MGRARPAITNRVFRVGTEAVCVSDSNRERDSAGRYTATVPPEDVLGVFDAVDGPAITSADVTDVLGCSREVARKRLAELHEQGRVERRKSGRTVLWWRTDDEENPFLRGFGALADTNVPEGMKREREQARREWAEHDDTVP